VHLARPVTGEVVRSDGNSTVATVSFDDHFTQATMFWNSMSAVEKAHIVEAFTFELGKVFEQALKERQLAVLARVDADLCAAVAAGLGLPAPAPARAPAQVTASPALSQVVTSPGPVEGRKVGLVVSDGADLTGAAKLRAALEQAGVTVSKGKTSLPVDRTFLTVRSIELDAVLVANRAGDADDVKVQVLLQEMFRHCKAVGAWGDGTDALATAGVDVERPGVLVAASATAGLRKELLAALGLHRAWDRFPELLLGSSTD
jgi:catalase